MSLPLLALLVYLTFAAFSNFYAVEIKNFHGYLTSNVRLGGFSTFVRRAADPAASFGPRRFLPDLGNVAADQAARRYDLLVRTERLDALVGDLPASGEVWTSATLWEQGEPQKVEVRHRGQDFRNFFWRDGKAWKIKTRKRELVDGYRIINLTSAEGDRLLDHLVFFSARQAGLPAPRSRFVHLYVNKEDQGLYLQEEQVDESMIRRTGRMPGDIFYGELYFPNEPKLSPRELFWNPYLWRKKARDNNFPEDHRPHLTRLLDLVNEESLESFDELYSLLDMQEFPLYFAVLSFVGDQHADRAHNHKLYFNPVTGKFEGVVWNAMMMMPDGRGVETMANQLFRKLCRDPRFVDRAQRLLYDRLYDVGMTDQQLSELDRILSTYGDEALDRRAFRAEVAAAKRRVRARGETIHDFQQVAEVAFAQSARESRLELSLYAKALASLRLESLEFSGPALGLRLFEDRDFDGRVGPADREVRVNSDGRNLRIEGDEVLLFVGRDFRAPYYEPSMDRGHTIFQHRQYTRLAFLENRFLVVASEGSPTQWVVGVTARRTVGDGDVATVAGAPDDYVSAESVHPWLFPKPPMPRQYRFEGLAKLEATLIVEEQDTLEIEPGTRFLLGPGVSIVIHSTVHLDGIEVDRLDPRQPWGVFVLQGEGASDSVIENSSFRGGSHSTLEHIYYSGMVSVHDADRVVFRNSSFSDNLLGDDLLRFAQAQDLRIDGCTVARANGDGIDCDLSSGAIVNTKISDTRNDGIDLMTSTVAIENSEIVRAGDKGISFGEAADSEVSNTRILDSVIGIALKDTSDPLLRGVEIRGCKTGISGYDKNWRYAGGGKGRFVECTLFDNEIDIELDSSSTLTLESCVVESDFEGPKEALEEGRLKAVALIRTGT